MFISSVSIAGLGGINDYAEIENRPNNIKFFVTHSIHAKSVVATRRPANLYLAGIRASPTMTTEVTRPPSVALRKFCLRHTLLVPIPVVAVIWVGERQVLIDVQDDHCDDGRLLEEGTNLLLNVF
jgi:hypothetical protein